MYTYYAWLVILRVIFFHPRESMSMGIPQDVEWLSDIIMTMYNQLVFQSFFFFFYFFRSHDLAKYCFHSTISCPIFQTRIDTFIILSLAVIGALEISIITGPPMWPLYWIYLHIIYIVIIMLKTCQFYNNRQFAGLLNSHHVRSPQYHCPIDAIKCSSTCMLAISHY